MTRRLLIDCGAAATVGALLDGDEIVQFAFAPARLRAVESRVKVARLSQAEIADYIKSGEWRGKAGGYAIQGRFARHVETIVGSHTNIVGLPALESYNLLKGAGLIAP